MGCEVNGPGEAGDADIGIAGGAGRAVLFKKGEIMYSVDEKDIADTLIRETMDLIHQTAYDPSSHHTHLTSYLCI
jgi:(E)-4-hydroxy-3-methylbut-2-enyl-diphosphate synthase